MKKFNDYLKEHILLLVIVVSIISSSIGSAATLFSANDISFAATDSNWEVNNVGDAINDLFTLDDLQSDFADFKTDYDTLSTNF